MGREGWIMNGVGVEGGASRLPQLERGLGSGPRVRGDHLIPPDPGVTGQGPGSLWWVPCGWGCDRRDPGSPRECARVVLGGGR